jgi:hypothetical protein
MGLIAGLAVLLLFSLALVFTLGRLHGRRLARRTRDLRETAIDTLVADVRRTVHACGWQSRPGGDDLDRPGTWTDARLLAALEALGQSLSPGELFEFHDCGLAEIREALVARTTAS